MPDIRKEIDIYLQELLKIQFKVSENISHRLTKGELREEFLKHVVTKEYPSLQLHKGILSINHWQSTQGDFLWLKENACIGALGIYDLNDCKMFMEIKSCVTAAELRAINSTAFELKQRYSGDDRIIVGMFCYSTQASEKTILKKFGFKYDNSLFSYGGYNKKDDIMQNVDFLYSLNITNEDGSNPYLVTRDITGCTLYQDNPVIQYFLKYFY